MSTNVRPPSLYSFEDISQMYKEYHPLRYCQEKFTNSPTYVRHRFCPRAETMQRKASRTIQNLTCFQIQPPCYNSMSLVTIPLNSGPRS